MPKCQVNGSKCLNQAKPVLCRSKNGDRTHLTLKAPLSHSAITITSRTSNWVIFLQQDLHPGALHLPKVQQAAYRRWQLAESELMQPLFKVVLATKLLLLAATSLLLAKKASPAQLSLTQARSQTTPTSLIMTSKSITT